MTDEEREKKEVKIGIGICTFKREKYVERNMKVLKENLLNNENALSYGNLSVCISDNGGTLVKPWWSGWIYQNDVRTYAR